MVFPIATKAIKSHKRQKIFTEGQKMSEEIERWVGY